MSDGNGTTITLEHPFTLDGEEYTELNMRRPKARDNLVAAKKKGTDVEKEIFLFSNLCGVTPKVIEELDMSDYYRLQEEFQGFLPRKNAED